MVKDFEMGIFEMNVVEIFIESLGLFSYLCKFFGFKI